MSRRHIRFRFREDGLLKSSLQALVFEFRIQVLLAFRLGTRRSDREASTDSSSGTRDSVSMAFGRHSTRRSADRSVGVRRFSMVIRGGK